MGLGRIHCAIAAAACGANACVSYGSHLGAEALGRDATQLGLNADVLVIDRGFGPQWVPNPELGYRRGVGRNLDLGGRLNAGSLELNARWQLLNGHVDLALIPAAGFGFVPVTNDEVGLFNAHLLAASLLGIDLSTRSQLVLGARSAATYAFPPTTFAGDSSGAKWIYLIGGVFGMRFPAGEASYWMPEVNWLYPCDGRRRQWRSPTVQAGVSLQLE